jgi:hypothetical protein
MTNVVDLQTNPEKMKAQIDKLEREMDDLIKMQKLVAKLRYEQYSAFIDAGFSREEALLMVMK